MPRHAFWGGIENRDLEPTICGSLLVSRSVGLKTGNSEQHTKGSGLLSRVLCLGFERKRNDDHPFRGLLKTNPNGNEV